MTTTHYVLWFQYVGLHQSLDQLLLQYASIAISGYIPSLGGEE
jgi:hypothetical protein